MPNAENSHFGSSEWKADTYFQPLTIFRLCLAVRNGNGTRLLPTSGKNGSEKTGIKRNSFTVM
jgi:hypothetical protein